LRDIGRIIERCCDGKGVSSDVTLRPREVPSQLNEKKPENSRQPSCESIENLSVNCESWKTNLSVQGFGKHIYLGKDRQKAGKPSLTPRSYISYPSVCKLEVPKS
jgi:hypothetical protein